MDKNNKIFLFFISILAFAAGLYLYRPQGLYFLADDFIHIPESANNLLSQRNSLRPIGNISLHIDYLFRQQSALGYHLSNLFLHLINSFFVFALCKTLIKKYAKDESTIWFPAIATIAFFVYPFHSEAIFWIIGRSGSLGALFFLPALILFLQKEKSVHFYLCSLILFELALLSYESSWIMPLIAIVIAILDIKFHDSTIKKQLPYVIGMWFVFVLHIAVRSRITGAVLNSYDTGYFLHFDVKSLGLNTLRLVSRTMLPPFANTQWLITSFFVATMFITALVAKFYRHKQNKSLFILLTTSWALSYLPYLSLGIDTHGVEGERYLYLPSVFFCLWLIYILHKIINKELQSVFMIGFTALSFLFLYQSRSYYEKAGKVTKTAIEELSKLDTKQTIFIENISQYNKGAVTFRLGFEEAVHWLKPSLSNRIIIVSKDSSDEKVQPFHSPNFPLVFIKKNETLPVYSLLKKDKTFKKNYIQMDTVGLQFNPLTDAWIKFTDTALIVSY